MNFDRTQCWPTKRRKSLRRQAKMRTEADFPRIAPVYKSGEGHPAFAKLNRVSTKPGQVQNLSLKQIAAIVVTIAAILVVRLT